RSQKMEAVGRLASGLAHDFGNLLTVVSGRAELLLMGLEGGDPRREHAAEILRAAEKATTLTRRLLTFSRHRSRQERLLGVNKVLAHLEPLLHRLLKNGVELQLDLAPDLAAVRADPTQVEQVILNLVVNARDALPEGGLIMLRTVNVPASEAEAAPDGSRGA